MLAGENRARDQLAACRTGGFFYATQAIVASQFMAGSGTMAWDSVEAHLKEMARDRSYEEGRRAAQAEAGIMAD